MSSLMSAEPFSTQLALLLDVKLIVPRFVPKDVIYISIVYFVLSLQLTCKPVLVPGA